MKISSRQHNSSRGALLIVAMLLCVIIAVSLTTYLNMATTALKLANRTFYENEAMNLAEAGLEQGLWAFNQTALNLSTNAWSSPNAWTISSTNATLTLTGFTYAQGATGQIKVFVQNYNSNGSPAPVMVAEGVITPFQGPAITKEIQVSLVRRTLFGNGLVGRNGITFKGNVSSVDSWNSNPTNAAVGAFVPVPYTSGVAHDKGTVAAINISADISVQNANIYGFASTGGSTSQITVGPQGLVGPYGTASGTIAPSNVSGNFTDNLPNATTPTIAGAYVNTSASSFTSGTLPAATDIKALDGNYYYLAPSVSVGSGKTWGSGITNLPAGSTANVIVMLSSGSGTTAVSVKGTLAIGVGSTLTIYTAGDVSVGGNGAINNGATQPIDFQIWGTNTTAGAQNITVAGNGSLSGVIYAPNANISAAGGGNSGSISGAFVGYTVNMTGNDAFHYDESLANFGGNNPFAITQWTEMRSATDRTWVNHTYGISF